MAEEKKIRIIQSKITGGFWEERQRRIAEKELYEQYDILNGKREGLRPDQYSYGVENFRLAAGQIKGEYKGYVYSDSEVGKWIEAAAYSLANFSDPILEEKIDALVDLMEEAQSRDGYLNTYFQVLRQKDRLKHFAFSCELYNMGHLMEAAAAYFEVTGKRKFLDMMCCAGDLLCERMALPEYCHVYDGHAEIELGLYRLYEATGRKRYLALSCHFINERGRQPCFFQQEQLLGDNDEGANDKWFGADHHQAHAPVREQRTAEGHAVKTVYLYSAVADIIKAGLDKDGTLEQSVRAVWENIVQKRMYVTGGIGSQGYAERFTVDYDLPNDRGYLETCASVGLCFLGKRMNELYHDAKYAEIIERALFNGVLAGWSLAGGEYFYTNTLHYKRSVTDYRQDSRHLDPVRQRWFRCACCPSNVLRLVASVQTYLLCADRDTVYCNIFGEGQWKLQVDQKDVLLSMRTAYPYDGDVQMQIHVPVGTVQFSLAVRIPQWCGKFRLFVNGEEVFVDRKKEVPGGYYRIDRVWSGEETVRFIMDMPARYLFTNPQVWDCFGKAALARGPLIYCLEAVDHEDSLTGIAFRTDDKFECEMGSGKLEGIPVLRGWADRFTPEQGAGLYAEHPYPSGKCCIRAIPYFAWQNRGETDMDVWFPYSGN